MQATPRHGGGGRVYKLNLKIPDEYKMAEALVKLAILEPGTNWVGERFKQKETNKEWSPGWTCPPTWEEKVYDWGILELRYNTRGSRGSRGSRGGSGQ